MSSPKYQKVETNSSDSQEELADSLAVNMAHVSNIPSTHSSQQLMSPDAESVLTEEDAKSLSRRNRQAAAEATGFRTVSSKEWFTVGVLCFINLINYMDRFTIAGVLTDIQDSFSIKDDQGGLLQTVFILSYMIFAPIFGYLGDRFSRKAIMAFGITLWGATTLLGSFMNHFGWFIAFRALVGIGEASYSTIAPTILSDLFVHDLRSKMLAVFYFAIPVGSGLGYIVGSETAKFFGSWHWALRVTPVLALIAVVLLFFIEEPERGQSEGSAHMETTSYVEDVKDVVKNRSFMLSTAGFTCVAFVAGALAWFGPKFMHLGLKSQPGNENIQLSDISYKFGIVAMLAGLIGVPLGSGLAQRLRLHYSSSDPQICAFGLIASAPFVYLGLVVAPYSTNWCFFFVFLAEVTLNLTWSIVADMLLVSSAHGLTLSRTYGKPTTWIIVSFIFGAITMTAGIIGVPLGSYLSTWLSKKNLRYDPWICAFGLLISAPLIASSMLMVTVDSTLAYLLVFLGEVALNCNWAIVADMLLYVVVPTRRSTAEAFQILISHAFGDAGSPYLVGLISESLKPILRKTEREANFGRVIESFSQVAENATTTIASAVTTDSTFVQFKALQYSLFSTSFVEVLGGVFFLLTAIYILRDRANVERAVAESNITNSQSTQSVNDSEQSEQSTSVSEN